MLITCCISVDSDIQTGGESTKEKNTSMKPIVKPIVKPVVKPVKLQFNNKTYKCYPQVKKSVAQKKELVLNTIQNSPIKTK